MIAFLIRHDRVPHRIDRRIASNEDVCFIVVLSSKIISTFIGWRKVEIR